MNNLNPTEQKLIDKLKELRGNSIWHIIIHNTIMTGCVNAVRVLMRELKSEGAMVPDAMRNIIGADAYELLSAI